MDEAIIIQRIGETASNKLKVIIVGITTAIRAKVFSIAPIPTVKPPRHPTIKMIAEMNPNLLNSISVVAVVSIVIFFLQRSIRITLGKMTKDFKITDCNSRKKLILVSFYSISS